MEQREHRINYFDRADIAHNYYCQECLKVLNSEEFEKKTQLTLEDILEIVSIIKYVNEEEKLFAGYLSKIENYKKRVVQWFTCVNDMQIYNGITHMSKVSQCMYQKLLWEEINRYDIIRKISDDTLSEILCKHPYMLNEILQFRNIVKAKDVILKNCLIENEEIAAKIILTVHGVFLDSQKYFLPASINDKDKIEIINKFIDSTESETKLLDVISNTSSANTFKIDDETRLKSKKKITVIEKKIWDLSSTIKTRIGFEIAFISGMKQLSENTEDNLYYKAKYSMDYIVGSIPKVEEILYVFSGMFGWLNKWSEISLVSNEHYSGVFEQLASLNVKKYYKTNMAFKFINEMAVRTLICLDNVLKENGYSLEKLIKDFFGKYIVNEFGAKGFYINLPENTSNYLDACRTIAPEIESVAKQYALYVKYGEVDSELLAISNSGVAYGDIGSLISDKYAYLSDQKLANILHCLFGANTCLEVIEKGANSSDKCLFDLLKRVNEINVSAFKEFQMKIINKLVDEDFLKLDKNNVLSLNKSINYSILKILFFNKQLTISYLSEKGRQTFELAARKYNIVTSNKLLSESEADYFDFYLNKHKFNNGYDLRNTYGHGRQAPDPTSNVHKINYYYFLMLLILLISKINAELCLKNYDTQDTQTQK